MRKGMDRHALALDAIGELGDFLGVQQELARPFRLVVEAIALAVFRNIGVVEDHLAVAVGGGVALGDIGLAGAQGFDLGAGQGDARLESLADLVVETRAPIVGDDR